MEHIITKGLTGALINLFFCFSYINAQDTLVIPQTGNGGVYNTCYATVWDTGLDSNYTNNIHSTITIAPLWVQQVDLYFEIFDTETHFDSLSIYDGPSPSFSLIGTYSGTSLQGQIVSSTSNSITLQFRSDDILTHAGFKIWVSCLMSDEELISSKPIIYPNPVSTSFYLSGIEMEEIESLEITDISGRIVSTKMLASFIDVSELQSGVYILLIRLKNGRLHYLNWIKA